MNSKLEELVNALYASGTGICLDFLNETESSAVLAVLQKKEDQLKEAGIGKQHNTAKNIRGDKITWLNKNENNVLDQLFFERIEELKLMINRRCFLGLNDYEFHFAKYESGTFYKRHKDIFKSDDARKISVILYLNQNWKQGDGGELKIYNDGELTVEPKAGTLVIFESHIEHEVLLSNVNRYSVTGWMKSTKKFF